MKTFLRIAVFGVGALLLSACLFEEPVFTESFSKTEDTLNGVWFTQDDEEDPRTVELAMFLVLDEERYLLHYPAGQGADSIYYEARPLERRGRKLLQLRVLASLDAGVPKQGSETYTLVWIRDGEEGALEVRSAGGSGQAGNMSPAAFREALEDPAGDWETLFDAPITFRRIKNK